MNIKSAIERTPILNWLAVKAYTVFAKLRKFSGSKSYWERRYAAGGTSGVGSYDQLAEFKAGHINHFIRDKKIETIIEFGCGDGNQITLGHYPCYIGFDVSPTAIKICQEKFKNDTSKSFFVYDPKFFDDNSNAFKADLSLSLDVIYHLVEDQVYQEYMYRLFETAGKYVIIYSSNFEGAQRFHEKDRKFSDWVDAHQPEWILEGKLDNKYRSDSKADFYIYRRKKVI